MQYKIGDEQSWIYFSSDDNVNWTIDDLYVHAESRYSRIGSTLVDAAIKKMRSLGGRRVGLWTPVLEAFGFWTKRGFDERGMRDL